MDVHLRLIKRKKTTGLTIKQIVNSLLRCDLSRPHLFHDILGDLLVERSLVSRDLYAKIVEKALRRVSEGAASDSDVIPRETSETFRSGSWIVRTLHRCPHGSYQIAEESAADARRRPTPTHVHAADQHTRVLSGSVLVQLADCTELLSETDTYCIPAGRAHALMPLTRDTIVSVTFIPSLDVPAA